MSIFKIVKKRVSQLFCSHNWRFKYKPVSETEGAHIYCTKCDKIDFRRPDMTMMDKMDMQAWCLVCQHELMSSKRVKINNDLYKVKCPECGSVSTWKTKNDKLSYSHN